MAKSQLVSFAVELQAEVLDRAYNSEESKWGLQHTAFSNYVLDMITEEGQWPQAELAPYKKDKRGELSAWGIADETSILHLAVVDWKNTNEVENLPQHVINDKIKRLGTFLKNALNGKFRGEEGSEAAEAAYFIKTGLGDTFTSVRLSLLSNRLPRENPVLPSITIDDLPVRSELWGLEKIAALFSSGQPSEPIVVDFLKTFDEAITCIGPASSGPDAKIYSAFIPGEVLGMIYVEHGPRLLELNVRSFLQARGKVNRGIRDTLAQAPERFLSYNNGITTTASEVHMNDDGTGIVKLVGLQIVNGGQTTASLARAINEKVPLEDVMVHMKLVEVSSEHAKQLVPEISKYANRQNAVSEADLTSNHKFHVRIEKLSNSTAVLVDGTVPTYWFYEKNRGSYQNKLSEAKTPADRQKLKTRYPSNQKFTKTDLAKYYNSCDCRPWIVARGAQKSFAEFMAVLEIDGSEQLPKEPDKRFFGELIGKKILFDRTDRIVREEDFGGWKSQIVTYTIAYISNRLERQLDFDKIWRKQDIHPELEETIRKTCRAVKAFITNPPGGQNIGEFCKKEEAWFGDSEKRTHGVKGLKVDADFNGLA